MGTAAQAITGDNLGLPPELEALRKRRLGGFMDALSSAPPQAAPAPHRIEDDPQSRNQTAATVVPPTGSNPILERMQAGDMPAPQVGTIDRQKPLVDQISAMPPGQSQAQLAPAAEQTGHLGDLTRQYNALNQPEQPLSLKQKILRSLMQVAPTALGAAFGGSAGATGAAQGTLEFDQQQQQQQNLIAARRQQEKQNLLSQIEAEDRMQEQEQLGTQRMTLQQNMEAAREKAAQEAQSRTFQQAGLMQADRDKQADLNRAASEQRLTEQITAADERAARRQGASQPGNWQPMEDAQGNPILFNSKTREVVPASGVARPGTFKKEQDITAPAQAALDYANSYLDSKNYTGTSDEALMEKFFELARPEKGFRMTEPQLNMLKGAQDAINSLSAKAAHFLTPSAPYFSEKLRQDIVRTMNDLANAKLRSRQGGGQQGGAQQQQSNPTPQTHTFNVARWRQANPQGDVNAAIAQAKSQGYQIKQ